MNRYTRRVPGNNEIDARAHRHTGVQWHRQLRFHKAAAGLGVFRNDEELIDRNKHRRCEPNDPHPVQHRVFGFHFNTGRKGDVLKAVHGVKQHRKRQHLTDRRDFIIHHGFHRAQGNMVSAEQRYTTADKHQNSEQNTLSRQANFTDFGDTQLQTAEDLNAGRDLLNIRRIGRVLSRTTGLRGGQRLAQNGRVRGWGRKQIKLVDFRRSGKPCLNLRLNIHIRVTFRRNRVLSQLEVPFPDGFTKLQQLTMSGMAGVQQNNENKNQKSR